MILKERGEYLARNGKKVVIDRYNEQKKAWVGIINGDTNAWNDDGTDVDDYKQYDIVSELVSEVTRPIDLIVSIADLIQKWKGKGLV